jgi:hypothetical protein
MSQNDPFAGLILFKGDTDPNQGDYGLDITGTPIPNVTYAPIAPSVANPANKFNAANTANNPNAQPPSQDLFVKIGHALGISKGSAEALVGGGVLVIVLALVVGHHRH